MGSLGLAAFHKAKSSLFLFSPFSSFSYSSVSASFTLFNLPYENFSLYAEILKYTDPFDGYAYPLAMIFSINATIYGIYSVTLVI